MKLITKKRMCLSMQPVVLLHVKIKFGAHLFPLYRDFEEDSPCDWMDEAEKIFSTR